MAYIRRLPSGRWQATVRVGKRRVYGPNPPALLKRQAQDWAREQEALVARGEWRDPRLARTLFADWFERWWDARVLEPETLIGQRSSAERHVLPHWSGWPLGGIGRLEVQAWVARLQKAGVGPQTVIKAYGIFRACITAAVDEELISRNPCRKITLPDLPQPSPKFFTVDQVDRIVAELPEPHATVALVMAWSGLRWEEVAGLEVAHVRTLRREVEVQQVVTRAKRLKPYAKSAAGNRVVPVPEHVLERLAGLWQSANDAEPVEQPTADGRRVTEHRLLFRGRDGRPLSYVAWWGCWQTMQRRLAAAGAGVPDHPPHTLRHTAASWWVQAGVPIFEVKELLGHARIESTTVYAHLQPGVHRGVREAWRTLLDSPGAKGAATLQ